MNFGGLDSTDKAAFQEAQNRRTYHNWRGTSADSWTNMRSRIQPSSRVWVQNFGDIEDYVLSIQTDRPLESLRGQGFIGIGRATVVLDNSDSTFYGDNGSNFEEDETIRIWLGYDRYRLPAFAGVIRSAYPGPRGDRVYLSCADFMVLFLDVDMTGSRGANNTPELVVEDFCNEVRITSNIGSGLELDIEYDDTNFDRKPMLWGLRDVQNSVFHVCLIDEEGTLQMYEREYVGYSSDRWGYDERNVLEIERMAPGEVINDVTVEYKENFFVRSYDQRSIDDNGNQSRTTRILLCNSDDVSNLIYGRTTRELANNLEAFRITSAATASSIDFMSLMMKQDGSAVGTFSVSIYSEAGGAPDTLLGTSQAEQGEYLDTEFTWQPVYFPTPVSIAISTNYWVVVDTSLISAGAVYLQASRADATGLYAYYSGSWTAVDDIQPLHRIRASRMAQTVAEDIVRFYKDKKDRIAIRSTVGVPQVQLLDDIYVDLRLENMTLSGRYVTERVQHDYSPAGFTTRHTLRESSE